MIAAHACKCSLQKRKPWYIKMNLYACLHDTCLLGRLQLALLLHDSLQTWSGCQAFSLPASAAKLGLSSTPSHVRASNTPLARRLNYGSSNRPRLQFPMLLLTTASEPLSTEYVLWLQTIIEATSVIHIFNPNDYLCPVSAFNIQETRNGPGSNWFCMMIRPCLNDALVGLWRSSWSRRKGLCYRFWKWRGGWNRSGMGLWEEWGEEMCRDERQRVEVLILSAMG